MKSLGFVVLVTQQVLLLGEVENITYQFFDFYFIFHLLSYIKLWASLEPNHTVWTSINVSIHSLTPWQEPGSQSRASWWLGAEC